MKQFTTGLCSVSFRKHTPKEILEAMQGAGLDRIEWGSDLHAPADDKDRLSSLVKMQQAYGVTCSSYGTYFKVGVHSADALAPYVHAAKHLGTSTLRIWAGEKNSEEFTEEEKKAFFDQCRLLAEIARREGVILCTECHNKSYTNRYDSALELMREVDSPHFRTYWQPNQFCDTAYNLAAVEALAPYTENVHVFHWIEKEKFPLIQGKEIWKQYLNRFSGEETLLLEFMPDGSLDTLRDEANALRGILEELK